MRTNPPDILADTAAVFAIANSLWNACVGSPRANSLITLSDSYAGMNGLMSEVMRIGIEFETWACRHVAFEECDEAWPYLLHDEFGQRCLEFLGPGELAKFDDTHCLRVALRLDLPLYVRESPRVPIVLRAANPILESGFASLVIQTVRSSCMTERVVRLCRHHDPFDERFEEPVFGVYGVARDGLMEHVADRMSYTAAFALARNIAPGIRLPSEPISMPLSRSAPEATIS